MAVRNLVKYLSAGLIVVVVAGLAVLVVVRARRFTSNVMGLGPSEVISKAVNVLTGFEYKESVDGQLIFALSSARTLGLSSGWHEIEGVRLELFDEGEEGPILTCEKASFNTETHDARLSEGIHVEFNDGGFLTTESGRFEASGRRFVADSQVVFVGQETVGNAGRATYTLHENTLVLSEGVVIRAQNGGVLQAPRVAYRRAEQLINLRDGCRVDLDGSTIESMSAQVQLDAVDGKPRQFDFRGDVKLRSGSLDRLGPMNGWTEHLRARRDAGSNWQLEASSSGPWVKLEILGGESFLFRSVETMLVRGVLGSQGLLNLRAENRVCLTDIPLEGGPRRGEAESARLWFEQGSATDVELDKSVVLRSEGMDARGHRARFSAAGGVVMLHGNPMGPEQALLLSDRGRVQCDQIHLFDGEGKVEARGNVQGQIEGVSLIGSEGGDDSSPLHFACNYLRVTEEGKAFHLRENARAWQGHQLVLADELDYWQDPERVQGVGHVRTTIPATMVDKDSAKGEDVVVVSRSLNYARDAGRAVYRGSVRYSDPKRIMSASEVQVLFDENNEVTAIEATGAVEIEDLVTGQQVTGDMAERDVKAGIVRLTGNPAQAVDAKGNTVRGRSLTWDEASGRVTVAGDTETIYYPEEVP